MAICVLEIFFEKIGGYVLGDFRGQNIKFETNIIKRPPIIKLHKIRITAFVTSFPTPYFPALYLKKQESYNRCNFRSSCNFRPRGWNLNLYISATKGQRTLKFWLREFFMKVFKHKKFQGNLRDWLPTFPKIGWVDMEWPKKYFIKHKIFLFLCRTSLYF